MIIRKRSILTGKIHEMDLPITQKQYDHWQSGAQLIQHAFPHLTPMEREFLMTGSTQEEWDTAFGDEEE
jgi:uncharacterized protein (DUF779 family)